jgi:N-acetylmuramoyl-L-alanine amidase
MWPGRKGPVTGLVMHFTAAGSGKGTADYFAKKEVSWQEGGETKTAKVQASAHIVVDRDGTVYQCVSVEDRAWHAGPATKWKGQPIKGNANDFTVGIEIANWGKLESKDGYVNYLGKPFKGMTHIALDGSVWEAYPEAQIQAVIAAAPRTTSKGTPTSSRTRPIQGRRSPCAGSWTRCSATTMRAIRSS